MAISIPSPVRWLAMRICRSIVRSRSALQFAIWSVPLFRLAGHQGSLIPHSKMSPKPGGRLSTRSKTGTNRCREHSATALGSAHAPLRRGYFLERPTDCSPSPGGLTDRQRGRATGGGEGALTEQNNRLAPRVENVPSPSRPDGIIIGEVYQLRSPPP